MIMIMIMIIETVVDPLRRCPHWINFCENDDDGDHDEDNDDDDYYCDHCWESTETLPPLNKLSFHQEETSLIESLEDTQVWNYNPSTDWLV